MTEPRAHQSPLVRVLTTLDRSLAKPALVLRQLGKSLALLSVGALLGGAAVAASSEPEPARGWTLSKWPRSHDANGLAWAIAEFRDREGRCPTSLDELVEHDIVGRVTTHNTWGEPLGWVCDHDTVLVGDRGNPNMHWDEYAASVRPQDLRNIDPDHAIPFFMRVDPDE